jgi:hypothetical protein
MVIEYISVSPGTAFPPLTSVAVLVADSTGAKGAEADALMAVSAHGPNELFSEIRAGLLNLSSSDAGAITVSESLCEGRATVESDSEVSVWLNEPGNRDMNRKNASPHRRERIGPELFFDMMILL